MENFTFQISLTKPRYTKPIGLMSPSPGLAQPWVIRPTIPSLTRNPNGVASVRRPKLPA
jgi:hypothetical protein